MCKDTINNKGLSLTMIKSKRIITLTIINKKRGGDIIKVFYIYKIIELEEKIHI